MLSEKLEKALNEQIKIEGDSSQIYLEMASWQRFKDSKGLLLLCSHNQMKNVNICLN